MKDLPGPPQEDLFTTLYDGTIVIENGSLPYKLSLDTRVKLPENCKLTLPKGTRLYGPDGLLILQNSTIVELAPIRPIAVVDTKSSDKPTPAVGSIHKIIHEEEKDNNKLSLMILEIIDLIMKTKNNMLLKYLKRELLDILDGAGGKY